jgi:hypothetical protein
MKILNMVKPGARFIRGSYEVVGTEKGYGIFDKNNNCITFRFETGNDFIDESFARSKCEKLELSELNRFTNPEGRY